MGKEQDIEDCTRQAVVIDGENFYLVVGDEFVTCTVPRENDPQMSKTRKTVETLCQEITGLMQGRKKRHDAHHATIKA